MGIKLSELQKAADRYQSFIAAQVAAPGADVSAERFRLGVINANRFTSKDDRLSVLANAALKAGAAALRGADAETAPLHPTLDVVKASQEAAFGDNDMRPIRYLHVALLVAKAVGKITVRGFNGEEGDATGFLVAPGILLTNHHVLPTHEFASVSYVTFDHEDGLDGKPKSPKLFDLVPSELFVADEELDYCFVAVSPRTDRGEPLTDFGYLRLFRGTGKVDPNRRQAANIVQHPLGQGKKVVLRGNYFMEPPKDRLDPTGEQNSLFYGADTLRGSSGSPVCTDEWFVVALHRGGVPMLKEVEGQPTVVRLDGEPAREGDPKAMIRYETNEGTRVSRLYASLEAKVAAASSDATHAQQVLSRIGQVSADPRLGPVDRATAVLPTPEALTADDFGPEELLRRKIDLFADASGYRPEFLGNKYRIELPVLSVEAFREVALLKDSEEHELKYINYSVVMHARRRTAFFAAGNVNGKLLWKTVMKTGMNKRPAWTFDPRMDDVYQPDDNIFSTSMQRGHLFKREDAVQGDNEDALKMADLHSFTITNATPMIANFNNVEWGDLEDKITKHLEAGGKVSYFAGPVFDVEDKYFNQLKAGVPASQRKKGMRVPMAFWKIVAWVENSELRAAGFLLDQSDEIREHGLITDEIDFGDYKQKPIKEIEARTGLRFPELRAADTH